ncbi:hydroxysqualene dehydroxylase HpnE [Commensalibacter oyaizuii]|uniref:Hydroxysqualene dehydroxylase HpnE n=1 Tax=Commensalibacter oyaizuii TaxID=3043873 RepID=A0ABT6Q1Z8_9PROT|nr:hydroxysqualene dehydroxylase HpnE [Commensalibacter sp. TBRC 16381]MDI2091045.1 hydroxysqualene dehydroxylase HpnE [Commensalibacter sp. TBRC 16381]
MVKKHIHIIGGGLAGLSAAVSLSRQADSQVIVYESSPACGGRARSFYDASLDRLIDNGNHLILSGNQAVFEYLRLIDSIDSLTGSGYPLFPFVDLEEKKRWDLLLSMGKFPWWLFFSKHRVPGFRFPELFALWNLLKADASQTVADCLVNGQLARRLLKPFAVSALNTSCEAGSALLLGSVVRQSLMQGGKACIPYFPKEGLSESFVNPALSLITVQGGKVHNKARLSEIHIENGQVDYFVINHEKIEIGPQDRVILALNAHVAEQILLPICPQVKIPNQFESILNLHYAVDPNLRIKGSLEKAKFAGVIGGVSEWIFIKKGVISITVSAANRFMGCNSENLASLIWQEVREVLNPMTEQPLSEEIPVYRLLWEKRASFVATIEQGSRRPSCYTPYHNLFLAGDWVATGLPATIEGAIRSGFSAAKAVTQFK